jgi:hypothetical protein
MKLILSRKGFDSSPRCGACASPILPDGRMISLPIPHDSGTIAFGALRHRGIDIGKLVRDLTGRRNIARERAHLDPDLDPTARPRGAGWRPAFGQDSAAQRHLERQGVGVGDLFLYFGWFRDVESADGRYRYRRDPGARNCHVIFGWLRVREVLRVESAAVPSWLRAHPHVRRAAPHNTIYLADETGGAGIFPTFHPRLQLTDPASRTRSRWRIPADFLPDGRIPLTYHGDDRRWAAAGDDCTLRSVAKGQEFVLDLRAYPGVQRWVEGLIADGTTRC